MEHGEHQKSSDETVTYLIYVLLDLETFKAIKSRPLLVEIHNFKVLNALTNPCKET